MVYVTHDQTEAMSMADQVILLRDGLIEQDAPPATLYAEPASIFAARFIGTPPMNILPLQASAQGMVIEGADGPPLAPLSGSKLALGVRPEHVHLVERGLHATVTTVEYLGADTIVAASVGSAPILVRVPGQLQLAKGSTVQLAWSPDQQFLFDAASGMRITTLAGREQHAANIQ
jgi:sn-glycerol 3-phosphate transport system ATP-binding protein